MLDYNFKTGSRGTQGSVAVDA